MASMLSLASQEAFEITSSEFHDHEPITREYTCEGVNKVPKLFWHGAPEHTKAFALICDDPDAPGPRTPWVHWIVYNIPGDARGIDGTIDRHLKIANGTMQGKNSFGNIGYDGPCPPSGAPHHYYFKLYALDNQLDLQPGATKKELLQAMQGHVLADTTLVGIYQRQSPAKA